MKPYPKYKASGIDWLGEIPSHWKVSKGAWSCSFIYGYPADSRLFSNERKGIPLIRIRDINSSDTEVYYDSTEYPLECIIKEGDILIGMDGDFNVAKWNGPKSLLNQRVCKFDKSSMVTNGYAYCFLPLILNRINASKYATTVKHLSAQDLSEMVIPVPPLEEQKAIAGYLDEVTGKIDALISEKTAQVEELRAYRSSLITETVTRGLNPDAPLRDSGIDWLGAFPQDWEINKLKFLVTCNDDVLSESTERNAIINYVEISDVSLDEGVKQYSTIKFGEAPSRARRKTQLNDVIISTVRTYLKAIASININNLIVSTGFAVLRPTNINSRYLYYSLSSNKFLNQVESRSTGVSYPAITATDLINIPILIPPLSEQQGIAVFLDEKTAKIDRLINELTKQLDELAEYKQAVITEAVTGKVDVRDYKPNI